MVGSQQGSPSSPGGGKKFGSTLRPVVCRQILEATRAVHDSEILIDGVEAYQITLVAQVVSVNPQSTNLVLMLDDGTGQVEARQWLESTASEHVEEISIKQGAIVNEWVRVLGTIKNFANKRHFAAMVIRPVTDPHEIYFSLLEALQVHMHYIRGPPAGSTTTANATQYAPGGSAPKSAADQFAHLPPMDRKIIAFILNSAPGEDGIHVTHLTRGLGPNVNAEEVSNALERLTESGHIYNTSDEFHYNIST